MMKLTKTIPSVLIISIFFFGNGFSQCDNSAIEYIAANKVKAAVPTGGDFFWDRSKAQFIVPYIPGAAEETSTIFAGALWLGGFDAEGNLKVAAQTYGNYQGLADFWSGPINDDSLATFENGCENFNRVWKTNREDILQLKEDFEDNGIIDLPIPISIMSWPARGNPHFAGIEGFTLPDQELAPFYDRNNNGSFEPSNGEYPLIDPSLPNVIPGEITWTVFNDIENTHFETKGSPIGAEIHFMVYAFNCSENELLNHTVFTRHKIFNKSVEDLFDFRVGFFLDFDLGCYTDDYFGCDTTLNTQYFYNSDNDDFDPQCAGIGSYGENPPVQAVTFLNHKLSSLTYFIGGGFCDPPFGLHQPNYDYQYYYYLSSRWRDGTPLTYGGSGYDQTSPGLIDHVFFDNPNDPNGWSLTNANVNTCEARSVMSAGSFDFPSGGQLVLDAAFSYHRQPGASNLENVNVALVNLPLIQDFYDNGFSNNCTQVVGTVEKLNATIPLEILPNPNSGTFDLFFDKTNAASQLSIFDFNGKTVWTETVPASAEYHTIDLSGQLPAGVYFVKWVLADGQFSTGKVIVK